MELRPLDRTDRGKSRLNEALTIYRNTILPEAQNPERQILYWIEHSKDNLADEFKCFAIQNGRDVVGYLQYSFFREEHIFFFEYLCIRDTNRRGLLPSNAVKQIEDFLAQTYQPGFTIVFEIARIRDKASRWEPDKKLIAYFQRLGFRKLHFEYRYPILQSYDGEISYPADLMVWIPEGRTKLDSSEMRTILRCIYFKHYLRWDRPFLEPERFRQRERMIDELYSMQIAQINDSDTFGTSGCSKRPESVHFMNRHPRIGSLLEKVFGPKLPRIIAVIAIMFIAQWLLGSTWLLIPFVLAVAAIYCLAEDTESSRKLLVVIFSRFKLAKPRSS